MIVDDEIIGSVSGDGCIRLRPTCPSLHVLAFNLAHSLIVVINVSSRCFIGLSVVVAVVNIIRGVKVQGRNCPVV